MKNLLKFYILGATCLSALWAVPGYAQGGGPGAAILKKVDIVQRLNTTLPLDVELKDSLGRSVTLGGLIEDRPVILGFVYYECPMLCTLTMNGMLKAINSMSLKMGKDYDVINLSFDHQEGPELAASKKDAYVRQCHRKKGRADKNWHFLTGDETAIDALTQAAGYSFEYIPEKDEYAHSSAIMVLTPEGKLSKYFYGIEFSARDLRLALVDASEKRIGTPVDKVLLWCLHYDPTTGKYGVSIFRALRVGGVITVAGILSFIIVTVRKERRKARKET